MHSRYRLVSLFFGLKREKEMKITPQFLKEINVCPEGIAWFLARPDLDGEDYAVVCEVLEEDARCNWSFWLRETIASNASTPEVLARLAEDEGGDVREAVAANPNTPSAVLARLAGDGNEYARAAVAKNLNTSLEVLATLATDENRYVSTLARNLERHIREAAKKTLTGKGKK